MQQIFYKNSFCRNSKKQFPLYIFKGGLLFAAILISFLSNAQNALDRIGFTTSQPAAGAYSLRRVSNGYTGNLIQVRRSNDNTLLDIGFDANGNLDTVALKTFVGSNNGFVKIWYDQSGTATPNNATQSTNTSQPRIVSNGVIDRASGRPSLYFDGTLKLLLPTSATLGIQNSQFEYNAVVSPIDNNPHFVFGSVEASENYELHTSAGGAIFIFTQGNYAQDSHTSFRVPDGTFSYITGGRYDGSKSIVRSGGIDGNLSTPAATGNPNNYTVQIGMRQAGSFGFYGRISEALIFPVNINTDRAGLEANQAGYFVPPTLSSVHIQSNNATTSLGKSGDVITVSFTSSQTIQTPTISIAGASATVVNTSGNNWTGSITVNSGTTEGVAAISIDFANSSGTSGTTVTNTTDASSVTVDRTAPTLSNVHIRSNNNTPALALTGNAITLSFSSTETITTPTVSIAGASATVTNISGNSWKGTFTVTGSTTEGVAAISIGFTDLAGNTGTTVTSVSDASSVTVDRTAPTLSNVHVRSDNNTSSLAITGNVITLSFSSTEAIQTPTIIIKGVIATVSNISGNNWQGTIPVISATAEGVVGAISIVFTDLAGNAGVTVTGVSDASSVTVDHTLPALSNVHIRSDNTTPSLAISANVITLSFSSTESLQTPTISIAGASATVTNISGNNWKGTLTINGSTTEGVAAISIGFADLAGNAGTTVTSVSDVSTVTVDRTAPTLSNIHIRSDNTTPSLALSANVITLSFSSTEALQTPTISIAGASATVTNISGNNWKGTLTVNSGTTEGVAAISIGFADLAGNNGTTVTSVSDASTVTVDRTVPALSNIHIRSDNTTPSLAISANVITLSFSSTETLQTPTISIAGASATVINISGNNWKGTLTVNGSTTESIAAISIGFADLAGNAGTTVTSVSDASSVTVDRTAPTLSNIHIRSDNTIPSLAVSANVITLSFSSTETINTPTISIAGASATVTNISGNNWKGTLTVNGSTIEGVAAINIAFADLAGNNGTTVTSVSDASTVTVDRTLPTLSNIHIRSDNSTSTLALSSNVITLSFSSTETLQTPTISIAGASATVTNISGNNWKGTLTVNGSTTEGVAAINIAFADLAGNNGTTVTSVSDASSVTVDRTAPTLSNIHIRSDNTTPSLAISANVITLSFSSTESLQTPTISIAGASATVTNVSGNNWKGTLTVIGGTTEGVAAISIGFADLAGNNGTTVTSVSDASSVTVDRTVPTLSNIHIRSDNTTSSLAISANVITLSFSSTEAINTPTISIAGASATVTNISGNNWKGTLTANGSTTEGVAAINIAFADLAGNNGTTVTSVSDASSVTVDRTAPTLSNIHIRSDNTTPSLAISANVITLSFSSTESLQTPTISIAGASATVTNVSGNNWKGTLTVIGGTTEGVAAISIGFADLAGNSGTTVTSVSDASTVTVDRTVPVLSSVHIQSNNANTGRAKVGDVITLSFTSSETIHAPGITIAGISASVINTSTNNWKATATVTNTTTEGIAAISIIFSDVAGNAGISVINITDASPVTIDRTAPTLSNVHIQSNNANTSLAKIGNVITLSFVSGETISIPTISIAGASAPVINTSGNNWQATLTVTGSTTEGIAAINIAFSDVTGNAGTTVTSVSDAGSVRVYSTLPTLSSAHIQSNNINTSFARLGSVITLSFISAETIQTPTVTIAGVAAAVTNTSANNWKATLTVNNNTTQGVAAINIVFADLAGNAGAAVTNVSDASSVTVDTIAPGLNNVRIQSSNNERSLAKTGDVITVSFTSDETIQTPAVSIAGVSATVSNLSGNNWKGTITIDSTTTEGAATVKITFNDLAGNAATTVTNTTDTSIVTIDRTSPTIGNVHIQSDNSMASLAKPGDVITVSFISGESIHKPTITIAGIVATVTNPSGNNWKGTITVDSTISEGSVFLKIAFTDLAGNTAITATNTTDSSVVNIDKTAPNISSVHIQSNNINTSLAREGDLITLSFISNEKIYTPAVTIAGVSVTVINTSGNNWNASTTVNSSITQGVVSINIGFTDLAGNTGSAVTSVSDASVVMVDRTAPTINSVHIQSNNNNIFLAKAGDLIALSFTSNETIQTPTVAIAGVAATVTNVSGNNWKATITINNNTAQGAAAVNISFADIAGNAGSTVTNVSDASVVTVDRVSPTISGVHIQSNNSNASIAQVGDVITVNFVSSKTIQAPTVIIAGVAATVSNVSANNWKASITVTGATALGTAAMYITYKDIAGNIGSNITGTTDASFVTVGNATTVLSQWVHIQSSNINPAIAMPGDSILLTMEAGGQAISYASMRIANTYVTPFNISGTKWTASMVVSDATQVGLADVMITYVNPTSLQSYSITKTTDSSSVLIENPSNDFSIRVYPNPVVSGKTFYIEITQKDLGSVNGKDLSLTILNIDGSIYHVPKEIKSTGRKIRVSLNINDKGMKVVNVRRGNAVAGAMLFVN